MPTRAWTFTLDGEDHRVELEYSIFTAWEKVTVDGEVLAKGHRWTLVSRYDFAVGGRPCQLVFNSPMYEMKLTVDNSPCEMLPCNSLLRPASGDEHSLLRPAESAAKSDAETLLHPHDSAAQESAEPPVV